MAATRGIVAAVYEVRLTTIPVSWGNWPSLIALFLLTDLAFYVEPSHPVALGLARRPSQHRTHGRCGRISALLTDPVRGVPVLSADCLDRLRSSLGDSAWSQPA